MEKIGGSVEQFGRTGAAEVRRVASPSAAGEVAPATAGRVGGGGVAGVGGAAQW